MAMSTRQRSPPIVRFGNGSFLPFFIGILPDGKAIVAIGHLHKPHAVIADGAAMQRVPGSMKFLQTDVSGSQCASLYCE
jgi:hypothetical protein